MQITTTTQTVADEPTDGVEYRWDGSEFHTGVRVRTLGNGAVEITRDGKGGALRLDLPRASREMVDVWQWGHNHTVAITVCATLGAPIDGPVQVVYPRDKRRPHPCPACECSRPYVTFPNVATALVELAFEFLS